MVVIYEPTRGSKGLPETERSTVMTEQRRTSTATYADAVALIADKLWWKREAEREVVKRIDMGQTRMANSIRECADRRFTEAMAIAEAVSVLFATDYEEVVDRAYEVMHEQYDTQHGVPEN